MEKQDAQTILDAGAALGEFKFMPGAQPFVVVPQGYKTESIERLLDDPTRKRAKVAMLDADSYIAYTKKHGSLDNCMHYANVDYELNYCTVVGVINDHGSKPDEPHWRDHTCTFVPKQSVEWKRWNQCNKQIMAQSAFAAFIEDNIQDIVSVSGSPSGTQMLEMAMNFEATSDKRFKRKIDLQTGGLQLEYVDKANEATSTMLKMFERFQVGIPVFQGSSNAYPVEARLKFRQNNDSLQFWFELIRPDRVFRQAVDDELKVIREKTGFTLLYGDPWSKE